MIVSLHTPIGDIVAKQPRAAAVFEQHRIDYCCEGEQPLEAACARAMADPWIVLQQIHRAANESLGERDWTAASIAELAGHIVSSHHAAMRRGVATLASWLDEAATTGPLREVSEAAEELRAPLAWLVDGLEPHLLVEEHRIFPEITAAEQARLKRRGRPRVRGANLREEIPELVRHHRDVDAALRQLRHAAARRLPDDFRRPRILEHLAALEADVHRHLHLENNILFPRALALEAAYA